MSVTKTHHPHTLMALSAAAAIATAVAVTAEAAVPGITGPTFNLQAAPGYISQPDGTSVYMWGYGCSAAPTGYEPATVAGANCGSMQNPGPTLIVTEGDTVTVTLTNNLPKAVGNTSILFPGQDVSAEAATGQTGSCSVAAVGLLATEAANGCAVTYTFTVSKPGTYAYYSGTRGDLQIEMGLYGALIVLPNLSGGVPTDYAAYKAALPANLPDTCRALSPTGRQTAAGNEPDYRLAAAAYDHPSACYDREYMFQLSEVDLVIHQQAEQQVTADQKKTVQCARPTGCLQVATEPYHPSYFMVNGRSFPDLADSNYNVGYPTQPYNGNPHAHPGELILVRVVGTGRWQHPLHEHGNHLRILARDGNLITSASGKLAGPLVFTTTSTPGMTMDTIYQWTGKGLNWDIFGHGSANASTTADSITASECHPDANGYYTTGSGADGTEINYYEWCQDHGKALESKPFGNVGGGGPVTLPDPSLLAMGVWYAGTPYFTLDANSRVGGTPIPMGNVGNFTGSFAYMWHSHNEREITTNNAFPGGMMMMLLVDPWDAAINEAN